MKQYGIYIVVLLTILLIPHSVHAECTNKEIADYRDMAGNILVYTNYTMENNEPKFNIIITNLSSKFYVVDETDSKYPRTYRFKDFTTDNELTLKGYSDNQRRIFKIYSATATCDGQYLATKYVSIPNYNEFASDEVCVGASEYSLCQRWGAVNVDYDTFVSQVNAYKASKKPPEEPAPVEKKETWKDIVLRFIGNYYVYLVSGVVIIILILAALKSISVKKHQFNFKV